MMRYLAVIAAALVVSQKGAADPSLECSIDRSSQVEIGQCLSEVEISVNKALDVALELAGDNALELDGITEREVALPALEKAQTAWEAYRDAECDYTGALYGGGSGTGIAIQSCRIMMTRARTDTLFASLQ